jgi:hypothetical protein
MSCFCGEPKRACVHLYPPPPPPSHTQALRNLYSLAVDARCLDAMLLSKSADIVSPHPFPVAAQVVVVLKPVTLMPSRSAPIGTQPIVYHARHLTLVTPCLLPELHTIESITVTGGVDGGVSSPLSPVTYSVGSSAVHAAILLSRATSSFVPSPHPHGTIHSQGRDDTLRARDMADMEFHQQQSQQHKIRSASNDDGSNDYDATVAPAFAAAAAAATVVATTTENMDTTDTSALFYAPEFLLPPSSSPGSVVVGGGGGAWQHTTTTTTTTTTATLVSVNDGSRIKRARLSADGDGVISPSSPPPPLSNTTSAAYVSQDTEAILLASGFGPRTAAAAASGIDTPIQSINMSLNASIDFGVGGVAEAIATANAISRATAAAVATAAVIVSSSSSPALMLPTVTHTMAHAAAYALAHGIESKIPIIIFVQQKWCSGE